MSECSFLNSLAPDAESFAFLDGEEGGLDLWFTVRLVFSCRGCKTSLVNVWILLLELKQTTLGQSFRSKDMCE